LLGVARADLTNAYPPEANVKSVSRCLVHLKPDLFLVFDRVETEGPGKAEWRYHAAFVEPMTPAGRFTAFGYQTAAEPMRDRSSSYDQAFTKQADASCQVAFLTPGVKASVHTTDFYYRWSPFSRPPRHLKVVQEGDGPMTLLTAFGPKINVRARDATYRFTLNEASGTVIVGGGSAGDLESDAHLAIAIDHPSTGHTELVRFGGSRLAYQGVAVDSAADDVYAVIERGRRVEIVETLRQSGNTPANR
jgi:hypothetical protein